MLGLSLASATAVSAGVFAAESPQSAETASANGKENTTTTILASSTDPGSAEDSPCTQYGGCGLSCAGCSMQCF